MRTIIYFFLFSLWACSTGQKNVSETLKQAADLQHEALVKISGFESRFPNLPDSFKTESKVLRSQMVDIPEIPHDHKYCNGQHNTLKIQVTDEEMLQIQKGWRDSVLALERRIQNLMQ